MTRGEGRPGRCPDIPGSDLLSHAGVSHTAHHLALAASAARVAADPPMVLCGKLQPEGSRSLSSDKKKGPNRLFGSGLPRYPRQRPTLPCSFPHSTIGGSRLNFRVRNGNGCDPAPMTTGNLFALTSDSGLSALGVGPGSLQLFRARILQRSNDRQLTRSSDL